MSGRAATENVIPGRYAISVGDAEMPCPPGWAWRLLTDVARLESGHTPSRNHPEWWGGTAPWIGIKDARAHHGRTILETVECTNEEGLANSAARLLPSGTVCLSRTASVGYVVIMGKEMATSQDFVNWVCSDAVFPNFLKWMFIAEKESLLRFSKGTTHSTIYFPEVKAFQVCLPPPPQQKRIVAKIEALQARSDAAKDALDAIPALLEKFRQSVLAAAFRGDLTRKWREAHPQAEPASELLKRTPEPVGKSTGRAASDSLRVGRAGLSVGHPGTQPPPKWSWVPLGRIAKMESGHTPSREHASYWNGDVAWIGIADAREHHGCEIHQTFQTVTDEGIANSAARLLPARTVCLSRTASVGYVTIMGRSMATSQDFANWICTTALVPEFLMYALLAEGDGLRSFGEGSTHTTIYFPELKALHLCLAPLEEQREIVRILQERLASIDRLGAVVQAARDQQSAINQSILAKAFRGELVPQDPTDEPAIVLLERIRRERGGGGDQGTVKRGRGRPKAASQGAR